MPISSKPRILEIFNEFGSDGSPSLRDYYLGGPMLPYPGNPMNRNIARSPGGLRISQFAGAQKEVVIDINSGTSHLNIQNLFASYYGSPGEAVLFRVRNNSHIFYSDPNWCAVNVGWFPPGSLIILENNGQITGGRGVPNSGKGGDAIWNVNGAYLHIYNAGVIAPGGGAGGYGGTGGMGYYQTSSQVYLGTSNFHYWCDMNSSCQQSFGGSAYCTSQSDGYCSSCACSCSNCYRTDYHDNYSYGGGGGAGGWGWGCYDGAGNIAGQTSGISSPGAPQGPNAGWGGWGGLGGGPGAYGAYGASGANGNYTGGSGGSPGGPGGYWHKSIPGTIALMSNSGTIYGGGANA